MRWFKKKYGDQYLKSRRTPLKVLKDLLYNWLYKKEVDARIRAYSQWAKEHEEAFARVADDVMRVRLEFGPTQFSTRFMLSAVMDESYMQHAASLKDMGPYIIQVLSAKLAREFSQIDFCRAKPIEPRCREEQKYPRYQIDSYTEPKL
jgi:hypothetical protein